jgi:hypothetical protein
MSPVSSCIKRGLLCLSSEFGDLIDSILCYSKSNQHFIERTAKGLWPRCIHFRENAPGQNIARSLLASPLLSEISETWPHPKLGWPGDAQAICQSLVHNTYQRLRHQLGFLIIAKLQGVQSTWEVVKYTWLTGQYRIASTPSCER